jgi:hypothetical protein
VNPALLLLQINGLAPYLSWLYRNGHQAGYEVMWAHVCKLQRRYEAYGSVVESDEGRADVRDRGLLEGAWL